LTGALEVPAGRDRWLLCFADKPHTIASLPLRLPAAGLVGRSYLLSFLTLLAQAGVVPWLRFWQEFWNNFCGTEW